ncbi:VOC family protein [Oceanispirochaeta sp.]|jgi:lactoylglutathione lyase|uniref:VOC family protein n=1 Tax=Oceanispirochaeta sp. TaxID=2035350 RepID=UPI00261A1FBD|nr:VOC family protein [Oceanispirochaeta sp.]MDA3955702.1 VOC family protein [Oceanispirochaeta sp.]
MKFCWTTIQVSDMEKSVTFYQKILGLKINRTMNPTPDMALTFLGEGETQVELIWNRNNQDISFGKDISMGFIVESIEEFTELMKKQNISLHSGPFQPNPFIKFIYILDPDGMKIQLVENIRPKQ